MIRGFAVLLVCQLAGEALVRALGVSLPGPVVGMGILVAGLALRESFADEADEGEAKTPTGHAADALLGSLSLLFVPAGVGVVRHLGLIGANATAIVATLLLSTLVTLSVTVGVFVGVKRLFRLEEPRP